MLDSDPDPQIDQIVNVLCVEPDPKNQIPLRKTLDLVGRFEVQIAPVALSASNGGVSVYRGQGRCLQTYAHKDSGLPTLQVATLDLPSLLAAYEVRPEHVSHIKLDIDGYEPFLLSGSANFLREFRPLMLIEFWGRGMKAAGVDVDSYFNLLLDLGDVFKVDYPSGRHIMLRSRSDLPMLMQETERGFRNLLVVPR